MLSTGTQSKSKIRKEQVSFSLQGVFDILCSLWGFMILKWLGIRKNARHGTQRCLYQVELISVCFILFYPGILVYPTLFVTALKWTRLCGAFLPWVNQGQNCIPLGTVLLPQTWDHPFSWATPCLSHALMSNPSSLGIAFLWAKWGRNPVKRKLP